MQMTLLDTLSMDKSVENILKGNNQNIFTFWKQTSQTQEKFKDRSTKKSVIKVVYHSSYNLVSTKG